jgi:RNA 3'-terminal phosphate cyclase (ATP)
MLERMIEVDGSFGEGGGQILRTAVSLAGVLGKSVRISNIRAGRSEPGLKAQHLTGVRAAAEICDAELEGAEAGSTKLVFQPSRLKNGGFRFDVGTAGSITLVLQTLMPLMACAEGKVVVEVTGGTDVRWSPPVDYLSNVTLKVLRKMGYDGRLEVARRGYYPRGGGLVRFSVEPAESLRPIAGLDAGGVVEVHGVSHSVGLPIHVAERQSAAAARALRAGGLPKPEIIIEYQEAGLGLGPGSGLVLFAETERGAVLGADSLGERGKPAEEVGSDAANRLVEEVESGALLDRHMGDMVVPFMALAGGTSEVSLSRVTQHTLTNVKVAELLAGVKFEVDGELGGKARLRATGLGP